VPLLVPPPAVLAGESGELAAPGVAVVVVGAGVGVSSEKLMVTSVWSEYVCGLSSGAAGQMGWGLVFFLVSCCCPLLLVLVAALAAAGDQKAGMTGFAAAFSSSRALRALARSSSAMRATSSGSSENFRLLPARGLLLCS
jgi:hypothetical protein